MGAGASAGQAGSAEQQDAMLLQASLEACSRLHQFGMTDIEMLGELRNSLLHDASAERYR